MEKKFSVDIRGKQAEGRVEAGHGLKTKQDPREERRSKRGSWARGCWGQGGRQKPRPWEAEV